MTGEAELKMVYSKQQQMHFNRIHEAAREAQAVLCASATCGQSQVQTHKHRSGATGKARASAGLTLPVSHENAGRQQTLKSKPFLMLFALPVCLVRSRTSVRKVLSTVICMYLYLFVQVKNEAHE